MGMRIPGGGSGLIPPKMVDDLIEAQKLPMETAKKRKEIIVAEKGEVNKLQTFLNELDTSLNSLKTKADFYKMKLESSHPDIIDGTVAAAALPGSYEFEVRGLARSEKELAYGFPDKNETAVGFGYMTIERKGKDPAEVVVDPGSTLEQVARQINDTGLGVKAMVVNTKYKPESYRLLVVSEESGEESKITIDEDTTFLEFKEQVTGRNLDILFEDVPVTDEDNNLEELIEGIVFNVKRAEPGTRVQVNITPDVDATLASIKTFVEKYNQIAGFVNGQYQKDEKTGKMGMLSGDGTVKQVMRSLQGTFAIPALGNKKYQTLAEIGITTEPKTGTLKMDDAKVKQALAENYDAVAALFIRTPTSDGIAERMARQLKGLRDPASGAVKSKVRALETIIKNSDRDIENKERQLVQKEQMIRDRFTALEGKLAGMQAQGAYLAQRFGGGGGGGGGAGGGGAGG